MWCGKALSLLTICAYVSCTVPVEKESPMGRASLLGAIAGNIQGRDNGRMGDIVALLVGEMESFNKLYVMKLEGELSTIASRLSGLESTVRTVSERAMAWDNIQNHMAVWTDQSRTMERKLDLLNRCHDKKAEWESKLNAVDALNHKLTALDNKINAMTRLEFKVEQVSERVEEIDSKVSWLQQKQNSEDSAPTGGWAELAGRGLLTTLRSIETNVANLTTSLSPVNTGHPGNRSRVRPHGTRTRHARHPHESVRAECELHENDASLLHDVSAKVDLVFDKLTNPEQEYDTFIDHLSRRSLPLTTTPSPRPVTTTKPPPDHHYRSSFAWSRFSGDRHYHAEDNESEAHTERIFAQFWRSLFAPFKKLNRRFRALEGHLSHLTRQCIDDNKVVTVMDPPTPPPPVINRPALTTAQLKMSLVEALKPFRQMVANNHVQKMGEINSMRGILQDITENMEDSVFRLEEESMKIQEMVQLQHRDLSSGMNDLKRTLQMNQNRYDGSNYFTTNSRKNTTSTTFPTFSEITTTESTQNNFSSDNMQPRFAALKSFSEVRNIIQTREVEATAIPAPTTLSELEIEYELAERRKLIAELLRGETTTKPTTDLSSSATSAIPSTTESNLSKSSKKKRILGCTDVSATGIVKLPATSSDVDPAFYIRYCDQNIEGGGWTTIQRRGPQNGEVPLNFSRSWQDYKKGFGDLSGEFWWGNDFIHLLSQEQNLTLRFDLWDFDDNYAFAEYSHFHVADEATLYELTVSGYKGNASDSFSAHNGSSFSTYDRDYDKAPECCPCAPAYGGGWWFFNCFESNLNGEYHSDPEENDYFKGVVWEMWKGDYSLKATVMSVRPSDYDYRE